MMHGRTTSQRYRPFFLRNPQSGSAWTGESVPRIISLWNISIAPSKMEMPLLMTTGPYHKMITHTKVYRTLSPLDALV